MKIFGLGKKTQHGTLTGNKIIGDQGTFLFGKYKKANTSVKETRSIVDQMLEED